MDTIGFNILRVVLLSNLQRRADLVVNPTTMTEAMGMNEGSWEEIPNILFSL